MLLVEELVEELETGWGFRAIDAVDISGELGIENDGVVGMDLVEKGFEDERRDFGQHMEGEMYYRDTTKEHVEQFSSSQICTNVSVSPLRLSFGAFKDCAYTLRGKGLELFQCPRCWGLMDGTLRARCSRSRR